MGNFESIGIFDFFNMVYYNLQATILEHVSLLIRTSGLPKSNVVFRCILL